MRLGDVCTKIGSGATPKGGKEAYKPSGIPLIRSQNVLDWSFTSNGLAFVDEGQAAALANVEVEPRDILLNITGDSVARACMVPDWCTPARVNQHVSIVRPGPDLDPTFLLCFLQSSKPLLLKLASSGATRNALTKGMIGDLEIELPNIETQRAIASLIGQIQQKIVLNQQTNDYLAEMAMTLFNRECPQSNEPNAMLSDIAQITMGQSPSGSSYNESGNGEVFYQGRAEFGAFFPRRRLFTTEPKRMAQEGDTLMSVRAPVGDLNIANENCCIGRGLAAIHSEDNQSFIHYLVRAQGRPLDTFNGDGTVFGSINGKALKELSVFLPGNDVISRLESQLKSIDALIRRNDDEMQALERMRDTLLPRLFSGEINVSKVELLMQPNNHLCVG